MTIFALSKLYFCQATIPLAFILGIDGDGLFICLIRASIEGVTPFFSFGSHEHHLVGSVVAHHNTPSVELCP